MAVRMVKQMGPWKGSRLAQQKVNLKGKMMEFSSVKRKAIRKGNQSEPTMEHWTVLRKATWWASHSVLRWVTNLAELTATWMVIVMDEVLLVTQ